MTESITYTQQHTDHTVLTKVKAKSFLSY